MEEEFNDEMNIDVLENGDSSILHVESNNDTEINIEENDSQEDEHNQKQSESVQENNDKKKKENLPSEKKRLARLPLARVKNIMKMDSECPITSQEAVFLVTKATVSNVVKINLSMFNNFHCALQARLGLTFLQSPIFV